MSIQIAKTIQLFNITPSFLLCFDHHQRIELINMVFYNIRRLFIEYFGFYERICIVVQKKRKTNTEICDFYWRGIFSVKNYSWSHSFIRFCFKFQFQYRLNGLHALNIQKHRNYVCKYLYLSTKYNSVHKNNNCLCIIF